MRRRRVGCLLVVSGLLISFFFILADVIHAGKEPDQFGVEQLIGTIAGAAILILGIVATRSSAAAIALLGAALAILPMLVLSYTGFLAYGSPIQEKEAYRSVLHRTPIPSEISRTVLLNTLVEKFGYQSYLEIGLGNRSANHDWINCRIKLSVDPEETFRAAYQMTSDEFFAMNKNSFDLVFVDGLHHAEQVTRDIVNALAVLNDNGTIVVHDCNPKSKEAQMVPQVQKIWNGDVWKAWVELRATRPDLKMVVIDTDNGCGVVRRGTQETVKLPEQLNYETFDKNRKGLLNLVDVSSFINSLKEAR